MKIYWIHSQTREKTLRITNCQAIFNIRISCRQNDFYYTYWSATHLKSQVCHRKLDIQSAITQNIKIWKLIFHSFQHIVHISCKYGNFWGGEGLHIGNWNRAELYLIQGMTSIIREIFHSYKLVVHSELTH